MTTGIPFTKYLNVAHADQEKVITFNIVSDSQLTEVEFRIFPWQNWNTESYHAYTLTNKRIHRNHLIHKKLQIFPRGAKRNFQSRKRNENQKQG